MGYFINSNIAEVNRLNKVTLAHNPHFLHFKSIRKSSGDLKEIVFEIDTSDLDKSEGDFHIEFIEPKSGTGPKFTATFDEKKINSTTFLVIRQGDIINEKGDIANADLANALTAQNLAFCLMQNIYFKNNFEIKASFETDGSGNIFGNRFVTIKAKGFGDIYNFTYKLPNNRFIKTASSIQGSLYWLDSIDYNSGNYNIELDIYTGTSIFLGESDSPHEAQKGKYLTTLSKAYHESGIWFDLNTLFSKKASFSDAFLDTSGWGDAGTVNNFRIIGQRNNGVNHNIFYASEVLYVINGYDYTLQENDLKPYIFDVVNHGGSNIKPLTNSPLLLHDKGQKHFFNFILQDSLHSLPSAYGQDIGLLYRFFTQSREFIDQIIGKQQKQQLFNIVNTIEVGMDDKIERIEKQTGKTVGRIEICLCKGSTQVSDPILLEINSNNTYKVKDFAFLNRLGGWDCFNFGNEEAVEFKTTSEIFYQTLQPGYKTYNRIESVSRKSVGEKFIVKTQAIKKDVAEWLRELSASPAVYELATKRYVVVDEFNLKYNSTDDLFQAEMKYHYSDNFNGGINNSSK